MSNDEIVRLTDVLEALGEEPELVCRCDDESIGQQCQWKQDLDNINAVCPIPFALHELTDAELCELHGDCVIVSAPTIEGLDKRVVPCLGAHKDIDGKKYVVLDGEEYSQSLFVDGIITLWQVR